MNKVTRIYTRIDDKTAIFDIETDDYEEARITVWEQLIDQNVPVLALIIGEK